MEFSIDSIYPQAGISFEISHKIILFIRKRIYSEIFEPFGLIERDKDIMLQLIISTKIDCETPVFKGPDFDKKRKILSWALWIPYTKVVKNREPIGEFLGNFFFLIEKIFSPYGVTGEHLKSVEQAVREEVIGNSEYSYNAKKIPMPDLTKFNFHRKPNESE